MFQKIYELVKNAYSKQEMATRTPSEALVLTYLRLRELEGRGGATREEISADTGVSSRTLDRAFTKLTKEGTINKRTIWSATDYPPAAEKMNGRHTQN